MERCKRCDRIVPSLRNHQCEHRPSRSDDDDDPGVLGASTSLFSAINDDGSNSSFDAGSDAGD